MSNNSNIDKLRIRRTEEVNDIIEKMPTNFGRWVFLIVLFIALLLFFSGWIIKYPDIVSGQITLNAPIAPIKLVTNSSGKLNLLGFKPKEKVKEGDYLAVIQNPAYITAVRQLDSLLKRFNPNSDTLAGYRDLFSKGLSLGEIDISYYAFLSALYEIIDYQKKNIFEKQKAILEKLVANQHDLLMQDYLVKKLKDKELKLLNKSFYRDSILHLQEVITDATIEKSKMTRLTITEDYQVLNRSITMTLYEIEDAQNQLQQLQIHRFEKEKEMRLKILNTYYALKDNISQWEQKYVLKSPMNGQVEFLEFWRENEFVQTGEAIFAIVPKKNRIIGQVLLPEQGSGKVKTGQKVIIKLDNYPYIEYGSIEGIVQSISLVASSQQTTTTNGTHKIGSYLVKVALPEGLKTNYGTILDFKFEIKGVAEIITKDRRLIERLFDNLKYIASNNK